MDKAEACGQCRHNCLRIHGKNMTSPPIISFFKIMIGANFPKFMYLPPKFGRTVSNLVGEKVNLEDTNGHQWVVTVRNVDNSVAFKQGWPAFSSDHGLNFGDFVIFHYLSETSFIVRVYDNSGCEKTNFPSKRYPSKRPRTEENCISKEAPKCHTNDNFPKKGYPSKRPRNGENFIAKDGARCHTSDKSSMNKQNSNTSSARSDIEMNQNHNYLSNPSHIEMDQNHCDTSNLHNIVDIGKPLPGLRPNSIEKSFIMINRDLCIKQEEDRTTSMFDLSNFEMPSNVAVVNRISVRSSPKKSDLLMKSQTPACTMSKDPVAVPEIFLAKDSCNKKTTETTPVWKSDGGKEDIPDMVIKRCQFEKPSLNISNEPLFGDNQIDASKMYQTQCRSDNLNSLQKATEVSHISRFSAPSGLQNYQKEPRDNQVRVSKMNPISSGASPNIIPKDEMMKDFKQEKIGVPQEFVDLTPEHSNCKDMIQGISGKKLKCMKGSQSQILSPTMNEAAKMVINELIDSEIPCFSLTSTPQNFHKELLFGDNQVDASRMYETQCRSDNLKNPQEAIEVSEISLFSAPSRLQNYQKEHRDNQVSASKMYPTSRSEASPNIIPNDPKGNQVNASQMNPTSRRESRPNIIPEGTEVPEIPCFSVSRRPHNYGNDEMMMGVSDTQEFAEPKTERSNWEEMIQGKEPKIIKEPQSQSFSPTITGAMNVVKNEPINTKIPRFSVSSLPQDYCKDKLKMGIKQEKIGVTQEFIDLTQELDTREEMIQGISGKESKFMKGSQSQSFSPTINGAVKVVKKEPTDTEIPCSSVSSRLQNRRDKMMMDFKRKIGITKQFVGLTPESYSHEEMIQCISGSESRFMKGSQSHSFSPTIDEAIKMVKIEPMVKKVSIETNDSSPSFLSLSCLVSTNTQSFFVLPSCLPTFKGKTKYSNTVCLQDSVMRLWPVVYHERYNLQVLTTGWEAFSRANSIQQGDECVFKLVNSEDAIFTVRIIRG